MRRIVINLCSTLLSLFFLYLAITIIVNYADLEKVFAASNWLVLISYAAYIKWIAPLVLICLAVAILFSVRRRSDNFLVELSASLLILLFLYTGLSKISEYKTFVDQLEMSPWKLISSSAKFIAVVLPLGELVVAGLLLVGKFRPIGFKISIIMMTAFTIYLGVLLLSGKDLPCTCGGVIAYMSWPKHLVLNITFLVIAVQGYLLTKDFKKQVAY